MNNTYQALLSTGFLHFQDLSLFSLGMTKFHLFIYSWLEVVKLSSVLMLAPFTETFANQSPNSVNP